MVEKIVAIKEKSSLLYYLILAFLIIPIIGLVVVSIVSPALRAWLVGSAQKLMNSSKAKDEKLKSELKDLQNQVDVLDKKEDDVNKKLDDVKKDDDADWHKKMR